MTRPAKLLLAILSASALLLSTQSWATNGYFSHGTSIAEKGMAGAGVAYSQDALSAANNPAGMVWQDNRYDIGAAMFAPMRTYTVTGAPSGGGFNIGGGNQSIDSENEAFLIPQYGQNWMLDSNLTVGTMATVVIVPVLYATLYGIYSPRGGNSGAAAPATGSQ